MRFSTISLGVLLLASATPAFAQDAAGGSAGQSPDAPVAAQPVATDGDTAPPSAFKITGGATLISDYRFRGLTQTNEDPAVQGTVTISHSSGFYIGTWASTIDGNSDSQTPLLKGYGSAEVDLYGGFTKTFGGVGVDAGLLYYYYADGAKGVNTDFFEPYASLSYTIGPIAAKVGGNYAWGGQKGLDFTTGKDDNIYVYGEASIGIPTTPVTLKGHYGYTSGSLGLANLNGTDDSYYDWSVTAEAVGGPFKVGASYVDTDITEFGGYAQRFGRGSTVLAYIGFSF